MCSELSAIDGGQQETEPSEFKCPVCVAPMVKCAGHPKMPASQDYWRCKACGLSAHYSRLVYAVERLDLAREHIERLQVTENEGSFARSRLEAINGKKTQRRWFSGAAWMVVGVVLGALFNRAVEKNR